ncbi:ribosome silencing factor [Opitutaceae bacterium]|nr:ribosome silencing factor [Opitutaceae bacterium]MDB4474022.1 ribosome silencing factor [Opitutaceae bacterium]
MTESSDTPAPETNDTAIEVPPVIAELVQGLSDKKTEDIKVLAVGEQSTITDFLILGTGMAGPHLRALRVELEKILDAANAPIAGVDFGEESGWIVFDAYQVMIHLFLPEQRGIYQLEKLWGDAVELDVSSMIEERADIGAPIDQ